MKRNPDIADEPASLIFRWKPERFNWRLWFFVLASLVAHAMGFYAFRVVHPPAARVTPQPTRVTLLQTSDPRAAPLLRKLDDRAALIVAGEGADLPEYSLTHRGVAFRPSFQGHEIPLRDLPLAMTSAELPTSLAGDEIVLPKLAVSSRAPAAAGRPPRSSPIVQLESTLAGRPFRLDRDLLGEGEAPDRRFRAFAAVRPDGALQTLILDEESDAPLPAGLVLRLRSALRFEPVDEPGLQRGWIVVFW